MNLPVAVASHPLLPACDDDHYERTSFSLIEMVPDLEKNDEDNIDEEIDEIINGCVIIPSCPKSCDAADPEEASININIDTNGSTNYSLGRRAVHPLKSSLKRSSGCSSPASTVSTSMMSHDETHTLMGEKSVFFSQLEIRSYGVTLGDAPTFNGCPITLDWDFDPAETETYNVDVYEHHRCDRRTMSELVIPPSHREYRLMQSGFSRREIKYAMEEAKQAAKDRRKTVESLKRSRRLSLEGMWGKVKLCHRRSSVF